MNFDENRWKWFLQASRTFLNRPNLKQTLGAQFFSETTILENKLEKNKNKSFLDSLFIPFNGGEFILRLPHQKPYAE